MLVVLAGLGAGLAGGLLMQLLRAIQYLGYHDASGDFLARADAAAPDRRVTMLFAAGLIAGTLGYLRSRFPKLEPAGLNSSIWSRAGRLPLVSTVVEGLESIVTVGMGMSLGREGALKDIGGALASKIADLFAVKDDERRLLVACAAGAGMAAAYNIPLGGALFAVEVLLGSGGVVAVLPALATSMIATAVSWLFLPNAPAYDVPAYGFQVQDIGWAILAAPIFGTAAVLWVRAIGWAESRHYAPWQRAIVPVLAFTGVGVAAIWFPDILGNGKGLVERSYMNWFSMDKLAALLVLRFLATIACLGSGAPGGLFTPTMSCGALLGAMLGRVWGLFVPGANSGVFAEIGSATLLAVSTQGPISAIVMVMELTHHIDTIMVPLLVCVVGASLVAYRFESRSIYTARTPYL